MTISFRTEKFRDTLNEVEEKINSGELKTRRDIDEYLQKQNKGVTGRELFEANEKFVKARDEGEELRARTSMVGRTAGRAIGSSAEGIIDFADAVLPETITNTVSEASDAIGEYIPESVKELADEVFDPYHGTGPIAGGEELLGTLGSLVVGGGLVIKGAGLATKGTKALSPGFRSVLDKTSKKLTNKQKNIAQKTGQGVAYSAGAAIVEDPEENIANFLVETFPESEKYLKRLASNKEDKEAEKYIKAFLANAGLGAVTIAPFAVASSFVKPVVEKSQVLYKPFTNRISSFIDDKTRGTIFSPAVWSSRMGGDDSILAFNVKRSNAAQAGFIRAEGLTKDLKEAVKKEYGKDTDEVASIINQALKTRGQGGVISKLKPETRAIVKEMRDNVKGLQKEFLGGIKKGSDLYKTVDANMNTYITQSYDLFDNPEVAKNIRKNYKKFLDNGDDPDGIFTAAIKELRDAGSKSPRDDLNKILRAEKNDTGLAGVFDSLLKGGQNRVGTTKSGKQRKLEDMPNIQKVLGKVEDPYENYVKTYSNLSRITSEQKYMRDVAQHLQSKGLARKGVDTEFDAKKSAELQGTQDERMGMIFGGRVSDIKNPLENLYTTPEYKKAIQEGLEAVRPDGPLMSTFAKAKGVTQLTKTVYNPITHGRNVMGNAVLMLANGMLPGSTKAFKNILPSGFVAKTLNKSNKELADQYAEYVELGIANSGLNINIIRNNLKEFGKSPEQFLKKAGLSGAKKLNEKVLNMYQAEDDLFKIAHFEKTLNYIKKSKLYKDLPLKEQKEIAAQRTRDLMPNYNLVPKALKQLRAAPVGDYLSFPAEMTRISKNLVKYTLQDLKSGDSVLVGQGLKRAGGLTAAGIGGDMIQDYSRNLAGISSEQDDAINNVVPSWEYNQNRIYLSGIEEDERGNIGVDYINLGPIDPFAYLKTAGQGLHTLTMSGLGLDDELSDGELSKIALGTIDQALGPFLSPSMITEAIVDAAQGAPYPNETEFRYKVGAALEPLFDVLTPGIVDLANRRAEYNKYIIEKQRQKGEDVNTNLLVDYGITLEDAPEGMVVEKKGYAAFPEGEVDGLAAMGIKRQRLDLTAGTPFAVKPLLSEIENVGQSLNEKLRSPVISEDDKEDLVRRYITAQKQRLIGYEKLKALVDNYKTLYGDEFEDIFFNSMYKKGAQPLTGSQESFLADVLYKNKKTGENTGYFTPYQFKLTDEQKMNELNIPIERFDEIYKALNGNMIEDYD